MKIFINYPLVWLLILSCTMFLYLIEDGSALGMSILLPFLNHSDQKKVLSHLLPIWDMNQTWLVFSLAGLYGGFSSGFSLIMGQFYLSVLLLVVLFVCRGAALEYTIKDQKELWLRAFTLSSLLIVILQGYAINELIISASNIHNDKITQFIIESFLGIITLILYYIQLGLSQIRVSIRQKYRIILLLTFIIFYALLILIFHPLSDQLRQKNIYPFYCMLSTFSLISIIYCIIKKFNPLVFLNLFAICNIFILEYSALPEIFPNHTSYIAVASNYYSLKIMIFLSIVILPFIFGMTRLIKGYFQNNYDYIHY